MTDNRISQPLGRIAEILLEIEAKALGTILDAKDDSGEAARIASEVRGE
jgi:hypothetical protein